MMKIVMKMITMMVIAVVRMLVIVMIALMTKMMTGVEGRDRPIIPTMELPCCELIPSCLALSCTTAHTISKP